MRICKQCFNDEELQEILTSVTSNGLDESCPHCGSKTVLINTDDLLEISEKFESFLDCFAVDENGSILAEILVEKWKIFNSNITHKNVNYLLQTICADFFQRKPELLTQKVSLKYPNEPTYVEEHSILMGVNWKKFEDDLIAVNRYHPQNINKDVLRPLFSYIETTYAAHTDTLYRARISKDGTKFTPQQMGAPPRGQSGDGRVNAKGVACLYLASDEDTCIKEVRAGVYDTVCVGQFAISEPIRLVDLSKIDSISPFRVLSDSDNGIEALRLIDINRAVLKDINESVSHPQSSYDDPFHYIGTQYISDYIKSLMDSTGNRIYDGIEFTSTQSKTGKNIVLFESAKKSYKCQCNIVNQYYITELEYDYKTIVSS